MRHFVKTGRAAWWLALCLAIGVPAGVHAQLSETSYEARRLGLFLQSAQLERDPAAEGKRIAYVRFERREVFEPDDLLVPIVLPRFASTWPNAFHWLTQKARIRRELLLREGDLYSDRLAEESMRNLRDLGIIALVNIVAVKTPDPARVGLIVYTRDLWSLRLEQSFAGAGATFAASAQLIERNFLGRGEALALRGSLDPLRFSGGQTFADPRLGGLDLSVAESFDLIWNRASSALEGSTGSLQVGRPFYNLAQRVSYSLYGFYADYVFRDTRAGQVVGYDTTAERLGRTCQLGEATCLPRVWRDQRWQLELTGHYRIGESYKQTFTAGVGAQGRGLKANAETGLTPEQRDNFERLVLPKVRRDIFPFVRYRLSLPEFVVLTNLVTLGKTENLQVGPRVDGLVAVPLRAYGASSDGLILHGLLSYVWSQRGGILDGAMEGFARLDTGRAVDQRFIMRIRGASPVLPAVLGRFVFRVVWDQRQNDSQRTFVALGGDNGLRGYAAQAFNAFGGKRLLANVEYRSLPWMLASVHVGAVLFYDAGSVYQQIANVRFHHSAGAGLRVMFPQLNRGVFRVDVGTPLDGPGVSALLTYGSEQYVPLTAAEDESAAADQTASVRQSL